jgi:hypothetical protein
MATTTPNYGWDVPTSTDYVKDGATAIETLGDDIDATLWTALGGAYPGLRLVKKQTIGSGVSTIAVTSAFSTTYDAYKIIVTGGASNIDNRTFKLKLGSTATGYFYSLAYSGYSSGNGYLRSATGTSFELAGNSHINGHSVNIDLINPFLAKWTTFSSTYSGNAEVGTNGGYLANTTSYTDFSLIHDGTATGGTIYVYGYGAS